ncbi:MAG TPA: glycosyltransferase family 39 protein [Thermoanaerobaculia bacterium]|jgi:hypothetical protein
MLADLAAGLGGVALFALPGLALTRLVPALRHLPLPRRLAYGYLLGLATVAGGLYVLSFLFDVPLRPPAVFILAALPLPLLLLRRPMTGQVEPPARKILPLIAAAVGAFLSLGVLAAGVNQPLQDWDGRMTWTAQARWIRAAGTVRPAVLEEGRWYVSHPRYPLLLPVAQAAVMDAFRADPDRQAFRPLYAAFFPVLLLVLYDGARRWAGRTAAALAVLAACGIPLLPFGLDGGAAGAYSDLPLACFYGAALVLLLRPVPRPADGVAAGLLLAACGLTKNEGALLAGAALLAAALLLRRSRRLRVGWRRLAAAGAVAALAFVFLAAWRSGIPNREDEDYARLLATSGLWPNVVTRIPHLVPKVVRRMSRWELWQGFWAVAPIVFLAGCRGLRRRVALPLLLAAAAPLAIAWGAYAVNPAPAELVRVTWNRMLVQGSVPLLLLLSLALRYLLRRLPSRGRRSPGTRYANSSISGSIFARGFH